MITGTASYLALVVGGVVKGSSEPLELSGGLCATGCPDSWLADGFCDSVCNNFAQLDRTR